VLLRPSTLSCRQMYCSRSSVTTDKFTLAARNVPICGKEEGPLPGPLVPPIPGAVEPCVAGLSLPPAGCRLSVRPLLVAGSAHGTAMPLASASAPSIGRKLNSSGLSWLALKPDSAVAVAAAVDDGAARRVSGDGAGGGGVDRCSRGDCDWVVDGCCVGPVAWSTGCPTFAV